MGDRIFAAAPQPQPPQPQPPQTQPPMYQQLYQPSLMLGAASNRLTTAAASILPAAWVPTSQQINGVLGISYQISLMFFILFLILVFIHFLIFPIFSISPDDNGIIPIPLPSDKQMAFTQAPAVSDLSANFLGIPACTYSFSMDIYLSGDFQALTIPRVLFYRSTANKGVSPRSNITDWSSGSSGSSQSNDLNIKLAGTFPDTNIVLWLDPTKNDLFASVLTSSDGTATNARMETTPPIENIPIRKVFRLTCVFTQQFIELYINGNLERSMALKNSPVSVAPTAYFFPVISTIGPNVRMANIAFWPRTLSAREAHAYGMPIALETIFNPVRSSL